MPDTIDSLQIEIQASANAADRSISKLANQLYKLKGALNGMNVGGLRSLSSSLQNFGSAMKMASSYKMPDFNRIANGITRLSNVDAASISTAASVIRQLGNALASLGAVSGGAAQISELASAFAKMGYKSATTAITNIPLLANAFRELMQTLSTAPTVSRNVIDLANAMANLSASGVRVSTNTNRATNSLKLFESAAGKTAKKTKSLAAVFGKLYATYFLLFRGFHKIAQAIDISSSLTEVQNVVSTTFGDMTYKMEDFAETSITEFGLSELAAKQYASRFQAMGVSMGLSGRQIENATQGLAHLRGAYGETSTSMADMSLNLTRLTADMASFYNMEQDLVAEDLQAIFTGMTKPLRKFGLDITDASLKAYALSKGIDANTKSMSQAEKTMLRYMYVMDHTSHVQGDFAKTSLTWANQIRILKQNFERLARVIGDGFIAALRPLVVRINQMMDAIIKAVQRVINALGKIFGWQMVIDDSGGSIADDAEDIADGYDDATDAAKKFKNFLLGIDELNVLPDNDDNDGGGGLGDLGGGFGGGGIDPGGIHFEDYESDIDNLFDLGKAISDKLKEMMENIDWDSIYEKAANFGVGLADFLNGLIDPQLFYDLGKTIAGALNTVLHAAFAFADTFEWEELGLSLAAGINGFFENFDFALLADTIDTWIQGIWTAIKTFFAGNENGEGGIDWPLIKNKLGEFFKSLDKETWEIVLGFVGVKLGTMAITNIGKWVFNELALNHAANILGKKLGGGALTGGFKSAILASGGLKAFLTTDIGTLVSSGAVSAGTAIGISIASAIVSAVAGYGLGNKLGQVLEDAFPDTFGGANYEQYAGWSGFKKLIDDLIESFQNLDDVVGGLLLWSADWSFADEIYESLTGQSWEDIGKNWREGIKTAWEQGPVIWFFGTAIPKFWSDFKDRFGISDWESIGEFIQTAFENMWNPFILWFVGTAVTGFWSLVKDWFGSDDWESTSVNAQSGFSVGWNTVVDWFGRTAFPLFWSDISDKFSARNWTFSGIAEGLLASLKNAIEAIKSAWNNFRNSFSFDIDLSSAKQKLNDFIDDSKNKIGGGKKKNTFATGGFPEDGIFFANHGEMVGQFSNGKTAVANNAQIVAGIESGVYNAVKSAMGGGGGSQPITVYLDGKVVYDSVVSQNNRQIARTGRSSLRV